MSTVDDSSRKILAQSVPLLQSHRDAIVEAMQASFRATGESEDAAEVLVDLLLAQGRTLAAGGVAQGVESVHARHRALGIGGRHYSRFGDALVAILDDVFGPNLPRIVPAVWGDAFWSVIRAVTAEQEMVEA